MYKIFKSDDSASRLGRLKHLESFPTFAECVAYFDTLAAGREMAIDLDPDNEGCADIAMIKGNKIMLYTIEKHPENQPEGE